MSSLAPSKREHAPNTLPSRTGLFAWMSRYLTSSVGSKYIVAVTGILLVGFVIGHMAGNLKVFQGREALNEYAKFLKGLGPVLWMARIGLLVIFLTHILVSLGLKKRALAARPIGYAHENTVQASFGSLTMAQTGLLIFAFVVYHIAHFTLGWTNTADGVNYLELQDPRLGGHDVYAMVISGFSNPWVAATYVLAQIILFIHLSHGIASVFQTLGFNTPRTARFIRALAYGTSGAILIGNVSIVLAVWSGFVR
jgi:succinate dehydrogenase / fumarate reductase cytochrome b subunit